MTLVGCGCDSITDKCGGHVGGLDYMHFLGKNDNLKWLLAFQ